MSRRCNKHRRNLRMPTPLTQGNEVQNSRQNRTQNVVLAVIECSILITAVVPVLIPPLKSLAEVVIVGILVFPVSVIAIIGILIGVTTAVIVPPAIFPIRNSGAITFRVAVIHRTA